MIKVSYKTQAEIFLKKASEESASTSCLPRIATEYYEKAAHFFVMDKNWDMAATQFKEAASYAMEDGEVRKCIEYLKKAGECYLYADKQSTYSKICYEQATQYAIDLMQYYLAARCQEDMAELLEKNQLYSSASSAYLRASTLYAEADAKAYSFYSQQCETKSLEMAKK